MKIIACTLTIVLLALTATGSVAQPPPPGPPPGPLDALGADPDAPLEGKDTRELVETLLMVRLARELALEKDQTVAMVQRVTETRDAMQTLRAERQTLLETLRDSVQAGKDAAVIQENLAKIRQHDRQMIETRQRTFDELSQGLTATQQARLYVFLEDFEGQMRQMAQQARRQGMRGRQQDRPDQQPPMGPQGDRPGLQRPRMQGGADQPMGPRPGGQGMQGGPGQPMGPRPGRPGMQGGPGQPMGSPPGGQDPQGEPMQQMPPPPAQADLAP